MTSHAIRFTVTALLALTATARADVIHVPGEQPTLAAAVAAAQDGDLILLAAGNYDEVVAVSGRSLSIVGEGGVVRVRSLVVEGVPPGGSFLLQNLSLGQHASLDAQNDDPFALTLRDSVGAIRVEDCSASGDGGSAGSVSPFAPALDGAAGLHAEGCEDVAVVRGVFQGGGGGTLLNEDFQFTATDGGPGAETFSSRVALFGALLRGGKGGTIDDTLSESGGDGGDGLFNFGAELNLSGCTLAGGRGGNADCDFFSGFCGSGGLGGDGLRQLDAASAATLRDCTLQPGGGGVGGSGNPAGPGEPADVDAGSFAESAVAFRGLAATSPAGEGEAIAVEVTGEPGDQVFVLVSAVTGWLEKPALDGLFLVSPPLMVSFLGVLGGPGLSLESHVPELGAGLTHAVGRLQLVVADAGGAHLGPATSLVILDAAE